MTAPATVDEQLSELADADVYPAVYAADEYSAPIGTGEVDHDVSRETSADEPAPAPEPKKRPGPKPNPNSQRSRRRAAAAAKAASPRKRATPNASATATAAEPAAEPATEHERGAVAILGWVARPLAMAGIGLTLAAMGVPALADGQAAPRAVRLAGHGEALSLDSAALVVYGPTLAKGIAPLAESIPWMAGVLEKAAKVSPAAAALEAVAGIALQVLANHKLLPVSEVLGTLGPAELLAAAGLDDRVLPARA